MCVCVCLFLAVRWIWTIKLYNNNNSVFIQPSVHLIVVCRDVKTHTHSHTKKRVVISFITPWCVRVRWEKLGQFSFVFIISPFFWCVHFYFYFLFILNHIERFDSILVFHLFRYFFGFCFKIVKSIFLKLTPESIHLHTVWNVLEKKPKSK